MNRLALVLVPCLLSARALAADFAPPASWPAARRGAETLAVVPAVPRPRIALIPARPVYSDRLNDGAAWYQAISVALELNDTKDRLGAKVSACKQIYDGSPECDDLLFLFRDAVVDVQKRRALLEGEVVAEWGGRKGLRPVSPWLLKHRVIRKTEDTGFNHVSYDVVEVWLERGAR